MPRGELTAHLCLTGTQSPRGHGTPMCVRCTPLKMDPVRSSPTPDPHLTNTVLRDSGCPGNTARVQGPQTDIMGVQISERPSSFPRENQRVPGNHRRLPECGEGGCTHQGTSEARCFPPTAAQGVGQCPREDTGLDGPGVTTGPLPRAPSSRKNWKPPGVCGCSTDSRWFFIFSAATPVPRRPGCRWPWPSCPCSGTCRAWARGRQSPPRTPSCFPVPGLLTGWRGWNVASGDVSKQHSYQGTWPTRSATQQGALRPRP